MNYSAINFKNKLGKFSEHWSPRVIAELNDYQFKLVKIKGDFVAQMRSTAIPKPTKPLLFWMAGC